MITISISEIHLDYSSNSFDILYFFAFVNLCNFNRLGKIKSQDQLLPFYLMDALGHLPGVPGLIVAGVFCASLSAISATMNSMTTITVEDYIKVSKGNVLLQRVAWQHWISTTTCA